MSQGLIPQDSAGSVGKQCAPVWVPRAGVKLTPLLSLKGRLLVLCMVSKWPSVPAMLESTCHRAQPVVGAWYAFFFLMCQRYY